MRSDGKSFLLLLSCLSLMAASSSAVSYGFQQRLSRGGHLLSECMVPN